ncbi:MAG TPA: endonuclease/exonuclease/phosphatase family protein [Bacteroidales bacterium]|nr:endonuclease/exonuclease/phosphatase family protein [Bacteroidales bacterium]
MAKKSKKKLHFFWKLMLVANILVVLLLLTSFSSSFINPRVFWLPAFAGIIYPYVLIVNIAFIAMWLFIRLKYALISLLPVLLGFSYFTSFLQCNSEKSATGSASAFKVMSYNVHNFDLYNYKKNWQINYEKRNKIFAFLKNQDCDIICFQEFVNNCSGEFKTKDTLITFLKATNVHAEYSVVSRHIYEFGLATFTAFPIVGKGLIKFPNSRNNFCIYTDVLIGSDTVRIYNAHLQSLHLGNSDIEFADNLASGNANADEKDLKNKSLRILRYLKRGFVKRSVQAELLAGHIKKCPYPVILCTDLNDTPFSYAYYQLGALLNDAFKEAGFGLGTTYYNIYPSFRIDYIFLSPHFKASNFKNVKTDNSDHYPVTCLVEKKKQ